MFSIFKPYSHQLEADFTRREMGSFKETHEGFEERIEKLSLGDPVLGNQTHSDIILEVDQAFSIEDLPEADAFITQQKNLLLMVKVADCQGIILFDPDQKALGVVHSGWKGSTKNILGKTIQRMKATFNTRPEALLMAISPSLGPCCAEFTDPHEELPAFCHPFVLRNRHVDFWKLSEKQAMDEGVLAQNIEILGICTKDHSEYFSFRRGDEERLAVYGMLI